MYASNLFLNSSIPIILNKSYKLGDGNLVENYERAKDFSIEKSVDKYLKMINEVIE